MGLLSLIERPLSVLRRTILNDVGTLASRDGLQRIYKVSLYRNALFLMLNTAVTAISGFLFWVVAARFYAAEDVGLASAAVATAGFLVTLAGLGLDSGLVRFISESGKDHDNLVNSCLTFGGLVAAVVTAIFLAGLELWSPDLSFIRETPLSVAAFVVLVVAWVLYTFLHNIFVAHRRAGYSLLQGVLQGVAKLALAAVLVVSMAAFGLVSAWGLGFVFAAIVGIFVLLPRLHRGYRPIPLIRGESIRRIARFSSMNYLAGLIAKVPTAFLPLMVVGLLGAEQNAYFYMAFGVVSNALLLIPAGVSLSLYAEGSHDEEDLSLHVRRSLKFSFVLLVPLIILVFLVGDKILLVFGRAYSAEATHLLWVLALSALPGTVNAIYFYKKRVEKKMKMVVGLGALTVVVTLGLSYLLLPVMGIIGAGIARLIGVGVVTVVVVGEFLVSRD